MTVGGHQDTAGNEVVRIAVPGGTLTVEVTRSATEPVLAIHGISSQRKLWNWPRAAAPELQGFLTQLPALVSVRELAGADHSGTIMTMAGAGAVAELITEALAAETRC